MKINKLAILLPLLLLVLPGCDNSSTDATRDYDNYNDHDIAFDDFYKKDGRYGVYVFGTYCSHCTDIKNSIFDYEDSLNKGEDRGLDNLYLLEFSKFGSTDGTYQRNLFKNKPSDFNSSDEASVTKLVNEMIDGKASTLSETYFMYTPAIYIVENNYLVDFIGGSAKVPEYLSSH